MDDCCGRRELISKLVVIGNDEFKAQVPGGLCFMNAGDSTIDRDDDGSLFVG